MSKKQQKRNGRPRREHIKTNFVDPGPSTELEELGDDHNGMLDDEIEAEEEILAGGKLHVRICLWEFGQNDPKRDSGSKMVRFGFATKLKVGKPFQGIVLSSEATQVLSPEDRGIIEDFGIAAINCSWNRLTEIPFHAMGKSQYQRKLPLIYAANTVNYGKPFKMNTVEAIAAALFIVGFDSDAMTLLYPFSFGPEFFKLNSEAFEVYKRCGNARDVESAMHAFLEDISSNQVEKNARKARTSSKCAYLDESDLPPLESDEEEEQEEEEGKIEGDQEIGL